MTDGGGAWRRAALAVLLALGLSACRRDPAPQHFASNVALTHGTAVGEVASNSAVIWARCASAATLHVRLDGDAGEQSVAVGGETDFTGKLGFDALQPATAYAYRAWCGGDVETGERGSFRTAPDPHAAAAVRFAWGGDVGGQNVCRDSQRGYPIFAELAARSLDFFIGLGDMIYADDVCTAQGRFGNAQIPGPPAAFDVGTFWAHWRYNRADAAFRQLLARVPYYAVWDDHEIRNDAGANDDATALAPGGRLLPIALRAFLDYQPLIPPGSDPTRLYRRVRWGRHLELFFLDTRQYRDAKAAPDTPAQHKTMLGREQLVWLEAALADSDATWKVIVCSVPLSIPTSPETHDGFANAGGSGGYEREALRLFDALRARGIRDSVWITTDVHFATGFVYHPFAGDPGWAAYEFTSGPLSAGVFPTRALDQTLGPERLFFYAPPSSDAIASFDEALGWFNFGLVDIGDDGGLRISIVNGRGATVFTHAVSRTPVE
jgi:alkaline phosphatase D